MSHPCFQFSRDTMGNNASWVRYVHWSASIAYLGLLKNVFRFYPVFWALHLFRKRPELLQGAKKESCFSYSFSIGGNIASTLPFSPKDIGSLLLSECFGWNVGAGRPPVSRVFANSVMTLRSWLGCEDVLVLMFCNSLGAELAAVNESKASLAGFFTSILACQNQGRASAVRQLWLLYRRP